MLRPRWTTIRCGRRSSARLGRAMRQERYCPPGGRARPYRFGYGRCLSSQPRSWPLPSSSISRVGGRHARWRKQPPAAEPLLRPTQEFQRRHRPRHRLYRRPGHRPPSTSGRAVVRSCQTVPQAQAAMVRRIGAAPRAIRRQARRPSAPAMVGPLTRPAQPSAWAARRATLRPLRPVRRTHATSLPIPNRNPVVRWGPHRCRAIPGRRMVRRMARRMRKLRAGASSTRHSQRSQRPVC